MLQALDEAAARWWADSCVAALAGDRAAIDRINVYPVADGDTGTNLVETMRAAVEEMRSVEPGTLGGVLGALARGALAGARGNSGMLLSQVLRGVAERTEELSCMGGREFRDALLRADELAGRAVAEPVRGTLLSVLHAAAAAAAAHCSPRLDLVVHEATRAAVEALAETPAQLPVLAEAGVVDAGGRGLVVVFDALHAVVRDGERLAGEPVAAAPLAAGERAADVPAGGDPWAIGARAVSGEGGAYEYEVMYLLSATTSERAGALQERLRELGDCVSVVEDGAGTWAVHVHCNDIGGAIEAGVEAGRAHRIRVVRFADQRPSAACGPAARHTVLSFVRGEPVAELFRAEGALVFPIAGEEPPAVEEVVAAVEVSSAAHVVLLPNDPSLVPLAEEAAERSVEANRDVVVVPTVSPVQGLAAIAVHDPGRRRADDAVAMAEASAATRRGELRIADAEALTWAGHCHPGDVLGLIDGEVVLLATDPVLAACDLADRMLTSGGELVTAFVGGEDEDPVGKVLAEHLRRSHPEVEFSCYRGGELPAVVLLGVE